MVTFNKYIYLIRPGYTLWQIRMKNINTSKEPQVLFFPTKFHENSWSYSWEKSWNCKLLTDGRRMTDGGNRKSALKRYRYFVKQANFLCFFYSLLSSFSSSSSRKEEEEKLDNKSINKQINNSKYASQTRANIYTGSLYFRI